MQKEMEVSSIMQTYQPFPVTLDKGKGCYVWDKAGNAYLDFTAGIATCNLGHVPDSVCQAVKHQLNKLWHCSNLYHIENQEKLAALLTENSCFDQVFFCNSGGEANEAAIKLIRKSNPNNSRIVTFYQSFHGRTLATLTATGQEKIHAGFSPLVPGFAYFPYNDHSSLDQLQENPPAAVMLELVQGEGGVIPAEQTWINQLVSICQNNGIKIVVDEVQTGMGRTGSLFAYEQYGFEPDIMTLAKGLGSGFPIGAMLAKKEIAASFQPGSHGSTFGGNPLATAASLATMKELIDTDVIQASAEKSLLLITYLNELKKEFSIIKEIRGKGLLIGLKVNGSAIEIVKAALKENLLLLTAGENIVRMLPPLILTENDILLFYKKFRNVLTKISEGGNDLSTQ